MSSWLQRKWSSYKYRFAPWVMLNLGRQLRKGNNNKTQVPRTATKTKDDVDSLIVQDLSRLFRLFQRPRATLVFRDNAARRDHFRALHEANQEVLRRTLGFQLLVRPSLIPGAGLGVFVSRGRVPKGSVVALYPGTIYEPYQPILLQSISNQFILRCSDGRCIDGNHRGLSRMVFKSIHGRDRYGCDPVCDVSWICDDGRSRPVNPLNVGQIVNNGSETFPSNVCYHECGLPVDFDPRLRVFLPNCFYESLSHDGWSKAVKIAPLIATKDIEQDEELLSVYFSLVD